MNEHLSETTDAQHACGEAYQAVGLLANMAGVFDDPIVQALLDNLSDAADGKPLSHESILPFYPNGWIDKVKQHRPGTPAMNQSTDTYYERERVRVVCDVEITYKRESSVSREDVLRRAREMHLDTSGVTGNGCYSARIVSAEVVGTQ